MSPDHDEKRAEIAEEVEPIFHGGPIWRRPAGKIAVIWVVLTAIGVTIGLKVPAHILPTQMSPDAHDVYNTIIFFTVLAAPVAALVYAIGAYSLVRWRHGASDEPPPDGPPMRGSTLASGLWVGASVLLVVVLLIWGMAELASENSPQENAINVDVIGQQWIWSFKYPGTGVQSNDLVLPLGKQVDFHVTSADVTHGFWPVQLGIQVDANPGEVTQISVEPNKLGRFDIRCSQLCGLYHSFMYTYGEVVTPAQFKTWLTSHGATAPQASSFALGAG